MLPLTIFQEKTTTIINTLFEGYYSLRQKTIRIPLIWLTIGAFLVVTIVLSAPAKLDYGSVRPEQLSIYRAQRFTAFRVMEPLFGEIILVYSGGSILPAQVYAPISIHHPTRHLDGNTAAY